MPQGREVDRLATIDQSRLPRYTQLVTALIGQTVAGFELLSCLGETRIGELFLGHGEDGRCIVKVLRAELCTDRATVERAFETARSAAALEHRGIERIVEAGWDGDHAYTLGDVVPGASAAELLARRVFEPDSARTIVRLAADALAAAHGAGLYHHALDPSVLYVGYASDRVQVRDFGVPALLATTSDGAAADVLALGGLAMTLMTGKPADTSQSLRTLVPEIAVGFEELIAQMLSEDAAERPTMAQVRDELGGAPRVTVAIALPDPPRPAAARDVLAVMSELALLASDEITPPPGPPPEPDES